MVARRGVRPLGMGASMGGDPEGDLPVGPGADILDAEYIEGSEEACKLLHKWFSAIVKSPDVEQGFRAILLQAGKGQEKTVQPFTYTLDVDLEDFVEDIVDVAEDYARKFRAAVRFAVRVAIGGKPATRKVFVLRVPRSELEEANPFDGPSDYTPDGTGVTALAVDLAQGFAKEMRASAAGGAEVYREIVQELRAELAEKTNRIAEYERQMSDVREMKWAIEDKREQERREGERRDKLFGGLMKGGQLLLAQIASGGQLPLGGMLGGLGGPGMADGAPDATSRDPNADHDGALCGNVLHRRQDQVLDAFVQRLTMTKVQALIASKILDDDELALFGELHRLSIERRDAQEQQAAPSNGANGRGGPGAGYGYGNGNGPPPNAHGMNGNGMNGNERSPR